MRAASGLNKTQFAEKYGIDRAYLHRISTGQQVPQAEVLQRLGITVETICTMPASFKPTPKKRKR